MTLDSSTKGAVATNGADAPELDATAANDHSNFPEDVNANAAGSSAADDQDAKTMADAIAEVLGDDGGQTEESSATDQEGEDAVEQDGTKAKGGAPEGADAGAEAPDEALDDEPSDEEFASYKPKTRKRIENLLEERKEYRELGSPDELRQYKSSHEQFTGLVSYMDQSNLNTDEVNMGFDIMAAMKNDPVKAYELLVPYVEQLRNVIGETLPAELQQQVDQGYLAEDSAKELSRARSREHLARNAAEVARQKADGIQGRQSAAEVANKVAAAVGDWEQRQMTSDPDYKAKQSRIMERVELIALRSGRPPANPEEAVALAKRAHAEVTEEMKSLAPKRREVRPDPSDSSPKRANAAAPSSMLDAIKAGLNAA